MPDQRSVYAQLRDVRRLANVHGHYDAADWLGIILERWLTDGDPLGFAHSDGRIAGSTDES